jgi:hypothetical protein
MDRLSPCGGFERYPELVERYPECTYLLESATTNFFLKSDPGRSDVFAPVKVCVHDPSILQRCMEKLSPSTRFVFLSAEVIDWPTGICGRYRCVSYHFFYYFEMSVPFFSPAIIYAAEVSLRRKLF